mmetsp:Transcript_20628/g.71361  ORF Transcript_20628/g.71361 Transcript_20628/m.71361 type:complete len:410 (+) Transcript_20628:422-1651(+)
MLGLCRQGLGLVDQLLDHLHDAAGTRVRLVLLLRHRGRLLLHEGAALRLQQVVVGGELVKGLLQHLDGDDLIGDGLLEIQILGLAVLGGALKVQLELRDLVFRIRDAVLQRLDVRDQRRDLRLQVRLVVRGLRGGHLVALQLGLTPVGLLDLVLLLNLEHRGHVVDGLDDPRERVELDGGGEDGELRSIDPPGHAAQGAGGSAALHALELVVDGAGSGLQEVVGARHGVAGTVLLQDLDGLGHGLELGQARILALLEILVRLGASPLQVRHELLVLGKGSLLLTEVLLGLGQGVHGVGELVLLLLRHLLAVFDLGALRGAELREARGARLLTLLRLAEVALHLVLQLPQDTHDLAALRGVRRHVGLLVVRLHEGGRGLQGALDDLGVGGGPLLALVGTAAAGHGPVLLL